MLNIGGPVVGAAGSDAALSLLLNQCGGGLAANL